jgi:hypothetical protein
MPKWVVLVEEFTPEGNPRIFVALDDDRSLWRAPGQG